MTVYYTPYADGDRIAEYATIFSAETRDAALAVLRRQFAGGDFEVTGLQPGRFGDAWVKVLDRRTLDACVEKWTAEAGELVVQRPGEHPGGKAWWVTPRDDIFVPVFFEEKASGKA